MFYAMEVRSCDAEGSPIANEEFERMLRKVPCVVGDEAAESWRYLLRGFWTSGLRLEELMLVSWDDRSKLCPSWDKGRHGVVLIPAEMQKNDTEDAIPLYPDFESLLKLTPAELRTGWVFGPKSLNLRFGRKPRVERPSDEYVGNVKSQIGEAANVVVDAKIERLLKTCDDRSSTVLDWRTFHRM